MDDDGLARPRWGMGPRFALAGVLIVLLCGGATAAVTVRTANHIADEVFPRLNQIHTPKGLVASIYSGGPKTFLILGSDKRYGSKNAEEREAGAHSDTILLVRFDPEQEQTSVLSIPRDLLVSIKMPDGALMYPEKINAAYTLGSMLPGHDEGANLAAETIKTVLPGLELNGIIDVTFAGFIRVVDSLGCVYVNVDHRYFNENIGTPETDYTNIDLQPGYQKLCYENALAYVRYRHDDSDFVRVARQQDFLRDLREQVSPELNQIDQVAKEVGHAISTNFAPSASVLLELAKLIGFSQGQPLRQVKFKTENDSYTLNGGSYVTSSAELEQATLHEFLYGHQHLRPLGAAGAGSGRGSSGSSGASSRSGASRAGARRQSSSDRRAASHGAPAPTPAEEGLYPTSPAGQQAAVSAAPQVPFPLLYPRLQTGPASPEGVRPYALRDRQTNLHHAYTAVFQQSDGGYYDVEGTDWLDPPIVADPQETRHVGRRTYLIFADGAHIHMVAWREHHVLYWVINTLLEELSNQQMLTIADSTQPLP
ncbi:MAG TPA: LCP family protein [Solirubrobacteraceae bacterium]|nr:LCP family protein [Solirubrobacteraceae bacterium]